MTPPPNHVLAAETRRFVEKLHDDWDAPHQFATLHWDGQRISYGTVACILPNFHPTRYPQLMARFVAESAQRRDLPPICACVLQIECFGVTEPGPDAPVAEQIRYDRDRVNRTFNQRDDAVEAAVAWCADAYGFLWSATKTRSDPATIHESFYRPGKARGVGGQLVDGLLAVARMPVVAGN